MAVAMTMPQNKRLNEQQHIALHKVMFLKYWYTFLLSSAKKQSEITKFKVLWRIRTHNGNFFIPFLNLNATPTDLVHGYRRHFAILLNKLK